MPGFDWYKRYPKDALDGYASLSLEERGAYNTLLDLMYLNGGPLRMNERLLSGYLNCSIRLTITLVQRLVDMGKIVRLEDGSLSNPRFEVESVSRKFHARKLAEIGATGGRNSGKSRRERSENEKIPSKNKEPDEANASISRSKNEPDRDRDRDREDSSNEESPLSPMLVDTTEQRVVAAWNALASEIGASSVQLVNATRRSKLKARLAEIGGLEGWFTACDEIRNSKFLRGDNDRGWRITFDWLLSPQNITKLMEGNYRDRKSSKRNENADTLRELMEDVAAGARLRTENL